MIPKMPTIQLKTLNGLRPPPGQSIVDRRMYDTLREQQLIIENPNRVEIFQLHLNLDLPEAIVAGGHADVPPVQITTNPRSNGLSIHLKGNAQVDLGETPPTNQHTIKIANLPAHSKFEMCFYTIKWSERTHFVGAEEDPQLLRFYLEGEYQFVLRDEFIPATVFTPLAHDFDTRMTTSLVQQPTIAGYKVLKSTSWGSHLWHDRYKIRMELNPSLSSSVDSP